MTRQVFEYPPNELLYTLDGAKKVVQEKLHPSWIKQRQQGKTTLSYIGGHTVIRLLNKAFNYQWSFEIVTEEIVQSIPKFNKWAKQGQPQLEEQPPVVKVLGRLTVPGLGIKEQYGSKVLIGGASEQESAFKSASTDAMKKCASLFGIGLELYGDEEGFEYEIEQQYQEQQQQMAPVNEPQQQYQEQQPLAGFQVDAQPEPQQYQTAQQAMEQNTLASQQTDSQPAQSGTVLNANPQGNGDTGQAQTASTFQRMAWDPNEVTKLKNLKLQLGVESNKELDPYVREFLNNGEVTSQNITQENIAAFNVFLQGKLEQ